MAAALQKGLLRGLGVGEGFFKTSVAIALGNVLELGLLAADVS